MSERRPHWDSELEQAVSAILFDCYENGISEEQVYQAIAAVEDWVYDNFQGGEYDNPVEYTPEERAIQRVQELCDLTERTVLDAMPELEGKVVVYTSLVRRALDGGDA